MRREEKDSPSFYDGYKVQETNGSCPDVGKGEELAGLG